MNVWRHQGGRVRGRDGDTQEGVEGERQGRRDSRQGRAGGDTCASEFKTFHLDAMSG